MPVGVKQSDVMAPLNFRKQTINSNTCIMNWNIRFNLFFGFAIRTLRIDPIVVLPGVEICGVQLHVPNHVNWNLGGL